MKKNLPHKSQTVAGFKTTLLFGERGTLIDKSHPLWNETTSRDSRHRGIRGYSILPWARIYAFSARSVSVNSRFSAVDLLTRNGSDLFSRAAESWVWSCRRTGPKLVRSWQGERMWCHHRDRGRRCLLAPWAYIKATGGRTGGDRPRPTSKQDKLDRILACMRNQQCENKAIRKLLETHSLEMINARKEAKDVKEKQKGVGETIRDVTQGSRQMEQTIGNWESWQQEIDNETDWVEEDKGKQNCYIRDCRRL